MPDKTFFALACLLVAALPAYDQSPSTNAPAAESAPPPPTTWIDPDTGHRVWRLSNEPNSTGIYFNVNAYTPDKKTVIYQAPDGLHALDLATKQTRLILAREGPNKGLNFVIVGSKTNSVYFSRHADDPDPTKKRRALCKVDIDTGVVTQIAVLPESSGDGIGSMCVNADETLAASTYEEGPPAPGSNYNPKDYKPALDANGKPMTGSLVQASNKLEMMQRRFDAHIPLALYTLDLQKGTVTPILHSTDWIFHLLFSPVNPALLMYCHEGPWNKVDRIWFIHTNGRDNTLVHKRTMEGEIAGHEFWDPTGKTVWYDLQTPAGKDYWLGGYNTETGQHIRYHMTHDDWSIHYAVTPDGSLFCGDGANYEQAGRSHNAQWIQLFHPELDKAADADGIERGVFHTEHLVNMSKHDYRLEPNVRFTPDGKMILFTSNMFGPSYYFGVEVDKAAPDSAAVPQ
jgi:oligogalacturonide lyase